MANPNTSTGPITSEGINFRPWKKNRPPKRILVIRLQAIGDVVLTFGYVQGLREKYPECQIDFLSRKRINDTTKSLLLFDHVYSLSQSNNAQKIALSALLQMPALWAQRYDIIIDLQRNRVSRLVRKLLGTSCWTEFDRYGTKHAGVRYQEAINALGLKSVAFKPVKSAQIEMAKAIFCKNGWNGSDELVLLNPGGFWKTRNWPIENYIEFARIWIKKMNGSARFVCIGDDRIKDKAHHLEQALGPDRLINLVGKTSLTEAYSLLFHIDLMISEDSGLMHMAATTNMAIFALIGSTPSYSVYPLGQNRDYLDSSDLACGNCHKPECEFGDVRCLTRYSPEFVFEKIRSLRRAKDNIFE